MEYLILILAFLVGVLTKFTDLIVDDKLKTIKYLEYLFGITYGILIAYIVINSNIIVSSLWVGLIIGVIITNKIDCLAHLMGIGSFIFIIGTFGLPKLNLFYLSIFTIFVVFDEIIEEQIDKSKFKNLLKKFIGLEIVCLIISIITGLWLLFLSILAFDIAYILTTRIGNKFVKK